MSKRAPSDPSDPDYEYMAKKFKELEKVFLHAQRKHEREKPPPLPIPPGNGSSSSSSSAASSRASSHAGSRVGVGSRTGSRAGPLPDAAAAHSANSDSSSDSRSSTCSRSPSPDGAARAAFYSHYSKQDRDEQGDRPSTSSKDAQNPSGTSEAAAAPKSTPPPTAEAALAQGKPAPSTSQLDMHPSEEQPVVTELDDELLKILGEDPSKAKALGSDIQADLAVRLQHIATSGLTKETRKELLDKYLPPSNCTLIDAPDLNPEVKAAVSETIYKRDKGIKSKQKHMSSAIACVATALTILLSAEQKVMTIIKILMDASKLLCDCQHQDSATRRNFVLYNLKKELKDQLQSTKIDKYLFSKDLAETLKAAKAISKSGADMKLASTTQQSKRLNTQAQKNLNWRAPPSAYKPRQKETQRKEPARKSRPDSYSRASSRPAPPPPPPQPPAPSRQRR